MHTNSVTYSQNIGRTRYLYTFNGKETDNELKGTSNSLDFGARIYDPRLGRWLSVDVVVNHSESPFVGMGNNSISFIDVNGDSTRYVNKKGETLFLSHDNLNNAIVVVSWKNISKFTSMLNEEKKNKNFNKNSTDLNKKLRTIGINYLTDGLNSLWKKSVSTTVTEDKYDVNKPKNKLNLHPEFGAYLVKKGNEVSIDNKTAKPGSSDRVNYGSKNNSNGDVVGDAHTHPNEGVEFLKKQEHTSGQRGKFGVDEKSDNDEHYHLNNSTNFDIIIQKETYKFHNEKEEFNVPKKY